MSQLLSLVWMLAAGLCAAIIAGVAFVAGRRRSERADDCARMIAPNTSTSCNSGVFHKGSSPESMGELTTSWRGDGWIF